MSLNVTPTSRCLEKKLMIMGFEALDLLLLLFVLSVLNLMFGQTALKILFVWVPSIGLGLLLRYGKRGKPDNYLLHLLKYQFKPGCYSAFPEPTKSGIAPSFRKEILK